MKTISYLSPMLIFSFLIMSSSASFSDTTLVQKSCVSAVKVADLKPFDVQKFIPPNGETGPIIYALLRYDRAVQVGSTVTSNGKKQLIQDWGLDSSGKPLIRISNPDGSNLRDVRFDEFPKRAFRMKMIKLDDVMKYQNQLIVDRMIKDYPTMTLAQAQKSFDELKKWFFVKFRGYIERTKNPPYMYDEIDSIDRAWHTFLLFTDHYTEFGQKYFGTYLHHKTQSFMDAQTGTIREVVNEDKNLRDSYVNREAIFKYMRETLGEETFNTWFKKQEFNPHGGIIQNGLQ